MVRQSPDGCWHRWFPSNNCLQSMAWSCFVGETVEEHQKPVYLFKNIWQFSAPIVRYQDCLCAPKCKGGVLICYALKNSKTKKRLWGGEGGFLWFCNKVIFTQEINIRNELCTPTLNWFEWNKMISVETRSSLMARPSETLPRINLMSVKCYLQALAAWAESKRKLMEQGRDCMRSYQ